MDKQELFNRVYLGLAKQDFMQSGEIYKAEDEVERFACRYRGKEGRKCAVGFLLSDEAYNEKLEGYSASEDVVQEALCTSLGIKELELGLFDMLVKLQEIHDYSSEPKLMREKLHSFAHKRSFSIPSEEGEAK